MTIERTSKQPKKVRPTPADLNVLYRIGYDAPPWLGELLRSRSFFTFELPTEFIFLPEGDDSHRGRKLSERSPRLQTGRVYKTGLYDFDRKFVIYQEICENIPKAAHAAIRKGLLDGPNLSAYRHCELFLAEVWSDCGDDGHVRYELIGHMVYIERHLKHLTKDGQPLYRRIEDLAFDAERRKRDAEDERKRVAELVARELACSPEKEG